MLLVATRLDALERAYADAVWKIRSQTVDVARLLWVSSPSLRDADVARIRRLLVPRVQGAQLQVAALTNAYVRGLAKLDGVAAAVAPIDRDAVVGYRGVAADVVYARPAVETYTALSKGADFAAAKQQGLNRLLGIVSTDIQQARTRQASAAYQRSGYEYTVRTLTGRENCALCVIASTQRYTVKAGELLPVHPGCDCGQRGIKAAGDPGQVIDPDLLEMTHAMVEAKFGDTDRGARVLPGAPGLNPLSDYADLIVTHEHGEFGPTLAWRGEHFTGPSDLSMALS